MTQRNDAKSSILPIINIIYGRWLCNTFFFQNWREKNNVYKFELSELAWTTKKLMYEHKNQSDNFGGPAKSRPRVRLTYYVFGRLFGKMCTYYSIYCTYSQHGKTPGVWGTERFSLHKKKKKNQFSHRRPIRATGGHAPGLCSRAHSAPARTLLPRTLCSHYAPAFVTYFSRFAAVSAHARRVRMLAVLARDGRWPQADFLPVIIVTGTHHHASIVTVEHDVVVALARKVRRRFRMLGDVSRPLRAFRHPFLVSLPPDLPVFGRLFCFLKYPTELLPLS